MLLTKQVYLLTKKLPPQEQYGLCSQIRRSAVSIPSNIAEGHSRKTRKDFCQFLCISRGSIAELETQLILVEDIYKIASIELKELILEIRKMLSVLIVKMS